MTNEEIDQLDDIELNYAIHEKVFGNLKPPYVYLKDNDGIQFGWNTPNYSGNIEDAWKVVEKLKHRGLFQVNAWHNEMYQCWLGNKTISASTASLAICKMALLTVALV